MHNGMQSGRWCIVTHCMQSRQEAQFPGNLPSSPCFKAGRVGRILFNPPFHARRRVKENPLHASFEPECECMTQWLTATEIAERVRVGRLSDASLQAQ